MPARRSAQFVLDLRNLRLALAKSEAIAKQAVAAGPKAIAKARKAKDYKAVKANVDTLAHAKKSHKNLAAAVKLVTKACCEQGFGCDANYD